MNKDISTIKNLSDLNDIFKDHDINSAGIFGSYAKGFATDNSDIDILIDFIPGKTKSFFELLTIKSKLETVLKKEVDLLTVAGLDKYISEEVLNTVVSIYEQR